MEKSEYLLPKYSNEDFKYFCLRLKVFTAQE